MLAKLCSKLLVIATLLSPTYALKENGIYQIIDPDTGKLARNLPGGTQQGPTLDSITFAEYSSIYSYWDVKLTDDEEGYSIVNVGSRNKAFVADPRVGALVCGYSEIGTKFAIESAGDETYVVKSLNEDLLWTVRDRDVILEHANGGDSQKFAFKFIEY